MPTKPRPAIDASKRKQETRWKLVEARSKQIAEAVSAARIPFLLVLTWAFLWAWSLYSTEFSYLKIYHARHQFGYFSGDQA
jgi:hypothetical protein